MRWLELTVTCDNEAIEAVSEILGRVSQGSAVRPTRLIRDPNDELSAREDPTAPYEITAHIPEDEAAPTAVEATERALWHLQAFGLRAVGELQVRSVDDADWTDAWKAGYVPQRIGRVVIMPSWLDEPIGPDEVAVRLDPGMAFGTGLHPTTRGCLTLLQGISPMPPVVLDVGSGSGILALSALRLGAERAVCYDTDPLAVEATLANAAANGLADRVVANLGSLPPTPRGEPYALVLANLVAAVLIDLGVALATHTAPSGTLLASGIIDTRADEVLAALTDAGFTLEGRLDDGEWVSLQLRHSPAR
ncbi:MAG: 50S ribosomal protein L11 methyltransferase [Chloroflexota bacterium]|nr:50S ribosomal protein L11 methyltransferase [Chloroflexota bacterium]